MKHQPASNSASDERVRKISTFSKLLSRPELGAMGGALLVLLFFSLVAGDSGMFSAIGLLNFLELSAQLGIIAIGACLLMIGGEFDLSVGSMIGFAGICIAIPVAVWQWPLWACLSLAFLVALAVGYLNGTLVLSTGLPSFIVTLAMLFILRGLSIALTRITTGRTQVYVDRELMEADPIAWLFNAKAFKSFFYWMGERGWIEVTTEITESGEEIMRPIAEGVPASVLWWVGLIIITSWVLLKTRLGNWIFAAGGDARAARNVGVPVKRVKLILFMTTASLATLFACIQILVSASADTQRGVLKEFEAIIAAVIGGTLLTGGYGSAIGAAIGAFIFGTVQMGIYYTGVDTDWFKVFLGVMMLVAVLFNNFIRKRATGE